MSKLGQHFLINKKKIKKIVEALELKNGDTIIEIGPGHGELTEKLKVKSLKLKVIAIEKDKKLAGAIRNLIEIQKLRNYVEIIEGDALKILLKLTKSYKLKTKSYKIVGNIPYYITGRLLRILSELDNKPSLIVLTVQKEVAERLTAQPPKMNLLAASVQFWAKPEIIGYISKKDFKPAPKVDSAIIRLSPTRTNADLTRTNAENYYKLIKILFKQPRKTILNNLQPTTNNKQLLIEKLKKIGINPQDRPQNLSIKQIIELSLTLL
jgi:16S rRNA (adenine1518-N6/adenine1519-N6)-dimethyltransferase